MNKKILLWLLAFALLLPIASGYAALTTTGTPPVDNNAVYQVGTTGADAAYKEATNSFNDGVTAYHFITQDTSYTNGSTIEKEFTVNGITATYSVTVHVLPAYDAALPGAQNPGIGSLITTSVSLANTTWFVDEGTYRDDTTYTAMGDHANFSFVGQDGKAPVLKRAAMSDYMTTPVAYTEYTERHNFQKPNVYLQNLVFDNDGRELLPEAPTGLGKSRGEFIINLAGANTNNFVLRDATFRNVGVSSNTTNRGNKNVPINIFRNSEELNNSIQKNFENITIEDTVYTKKGLGFISSNHSSGTYIRGLTTATVNPSLQVYPIKVEHASGTSYLTTAKNQVVVEGPLALHAPLIYIQDIRYDLNTVPADYRYVYYGGTNGGSSSPSMLVSSQYVDPITMLTGAGLTASQAANYRPSVFDRQENVWLVDESMSTHVNTQFEYLRYNYIEKSYSSWLGYTRGNLSFSSNQPLINIKYIAQGPIDGFTVPNYTTYPVNITAVSGQAVSAEGTALVPVAQGATFNLGPSAANVKIYNFDFHELARYTLQEALHGTQATGTAGAVVPADPNNDLYDATLSPRLDMVAGSYAVTQTAKVTGTGVSEATFQNNKFTQLAETLSHTGQDNPLTVVEGSFLDVPVQVATAYTGMQPGSLLPATRIQSDLGAEDQSLYYLSSDPAVFTVSALGRIQAISPGTAFLYVKAKDENNKGEIEKPYVRFVVTVTKADPDYATLAVPLKAEKVLRNGTLKEGQFTFILKDAAGKVLAEAQNKGDGTIPFPDRTFSKVVSNYRYTIQEKPGDAQGIQYDATVYTLSVTTKAVDGKLQATVNVEKDGVPYDGALRFTNVADIPKTGDSALNLPFMLAALALGLFAAALVTGKRKKA